ncbi:YqzG/YhdC family protein [Oceanobacillus senegalensis]|uniref:YqzG/YhdC family protein n=1 Tax=Oceanobacillus senegalensis TaxID=1936063 RepID=UPI000A31437D|nr:YqzG/YhdC family protein [Oceanobacillus senegalensis]
MKKIVGIMMVFMLFNATYYTIPHPPLLHAQEKPIPSYAKWGRLAMKETKAKYSNAQIIDYLHIGRETKGDHSIEKFKLWLREGQREFGVFIDIEFVTESEEVISINFEETDR